MRPLLIVSILVVVVTLGDAYSKYGRTCADIGCRSNEVCVLKEKTCTLYNAGECGTYPTCEKASNVAASCEKYVCPPSQICKMDGSHPRCYDNPAYNNREHKRPVESYQPMSPDSENMPNAPVFPSNPNSHYPSYPQQPAGHYPQQPPVNPQYPQQPAQNPQYPQQPAQNPQYPGSGVYPQLPSGGRQTTPRPNVYHPGQQYPASGGGYQGGQIGSGYPGAQNYPGYPMQGANMPPRQGGGYPVQGGGYPVQGAGYPGYPSYTNTGARYPSSGSGYPQQGNYYPPQGTYGNTGYRQNTGSDSSSILDKITNSLKKLGLFWFTLKCVTAHIYGVHT